MIRVSGGRSGKRQADGEAAPDGADAARAGESPASLAADRGLVRGVGGTALVALTINAIIGSGIFGLPSKVHALVGPYGLLAYLACAAIVSVIALCFSEVASRFTLTGGPYLYAQRAFGPAAGFAVGWLLWLTRLSAIAAICNVMMSYLGFFWAPAGAGAGRVAATSLVMAALAAVNLVGVRPAAAAATAFAAAKIVPLLLFVGAGAFFVEPAAFADAPAPTPQAFSQAVLILIFAFVGFETTTVAAGEARHPRRDLPIALFVGIGVSTALYVLVQAVCVGTLPTLADSETPLADASARIAGVWGGAIISLGALISTAGTLLVAVLTGPRVLFAMSAQGQLPAWFSRTHPRFHTPHVAILLTAGAGLALAISGTFVYLLTLSVLARLAAYLATAAALLVFRRRADEPPARFVVPAGGLVVALAAAACVWLVTTSGARELRDVGLATAIGLALHAAHRRAGARRRAA